MVLPGLAELSTKVTVSTVEFGIFGALFARVTVVVLEFDGLLASVTVVVLEFVGLLIKVIVVVLGLAVFSTNVTVSTVSGFCTKVTVLVLGLVVGEAAADSEGAMDVTVVTPFPELLCGRDGSTEGDCLA